MAAGNVFEWLPCLYSVQQSPLSEPTDIFYQPSQKSWIGVSSVNQRDHTFSIQHSEWTMSIHILYIMLLFYASSLNA